MPNDPSVAAVVVPLLATYLLHSTLLLGGIWLILICARARSAALQDRLWKLAALAPLLTAPLQLAAADRFGDWSVWTLPAISLANSSEASPMPRAEARPAPVSNDFSDSQAETPAEPFVEIIPAFPTTEDHSHAPLPTIEPAEPIVDLPAMIPDAAIEPAVVEETEPTFACLPGSSPAIAVAPAPDGIPAVDDHPVAASQPGHWRGPVTAVCMALFAIGLLRFAWCSLTAGLSLRRLQTITAGPLRESLDRLVQQRGIRRAVRLALSSAAGEPSAGGVIRWTIIVPARIDERLTPAEQHALLAHELAHLVRRDPLWLAVGSALCCCLPFQPLNFLAVRRWRQAAEELCDDWAIAGGVRPLTLANCLTRVAEWRLAPMPLGLTSDVGKSRFARRIARLVNEELRIDRWSTPWRRRFLLAGITACAALLTCCGPRMQAAAARVESISATEERMAGAGLSAAQEAPGARAEDHQLDEPHAPASPEFEAGIRAELASLLADLERVEQLIGQLGNAPEIEAVRAGLRSRLARLRSRLPSGDPSEQALLEDDALSTVEATK